MITRRVWLAFAATAPLLAADGEDDARKAADKWLAMLDQGKYKDAWKQASQHHRPQITSDEWAGQVRSMREASGVLRERKFTSAKPSKTHAGAPDGDHMILEYSTAFEKKSKAVELLVMSREAGGWKAAGYSIY
ncbi:MAG: DUF4019 domain-containing protein [Bryobacteraceae bacterium]